MLSLRGWLAGCMSVGVLLSSTGRARRWGGGFWIVQCGEVMVRCGAKIAAL